MWKSTCRPFLFKIIWPYLRQTPTHDFKTSEFLKWSQNVETKIYVKKKSTCLFLRKIFLEINSIPKIFYWQVFKVYLLCITKQNNIMHSINTYWLYFLTYLGQMLKCYCAVMSWSTQKRFCRICTTLIGEIPARETFVNFGNFKPIRESLSRETRSWTLHAKVYLCEIFTSCNSWKFIHWKIFYNFIAKTSI